MPRSLLGRMLFLTLLVVLMAQALSSVIWVSQLRASQMEGLLTSARSLAHSMAASVAATGPPSPANCRAIAARVAASAGAIRRCSALR